MRGITVKAIGYLRVSTEEQGQEERFSLPHQREHIEKECKARGWQLVAVYEDTESGKSTRRRYGFKSAIEAMVNADILIVHELDRLSRNMIDTLIIVDELNKSGKKFFSIHDNIDSSNEQGELQLHILAVFAHYFRKQLGRKVYGSMLTRAEQGLWNSKPPFGYGLENNKLTVNPDEAWIIRQMFDMYLKNMGLRAISEHFNSLGIKTRQGYSWYPFPIKAILKNQVYIGNSIWNKTKRNDTKDIDRPVDEWVTVEDTHEPIVDKQTFYAVQDRFRRKSEMGGRAQQSDYLLSGLIRCGHCGSPMVGNRNAGRKSKKTGIAPVYKRYVCSGYHKQGICKYVFAHKLDVEEIVLDYIRGYVGPPDQAKLLQKKSAVNVNELKLEQQRVISELSNIGQRFQKQIEAYEAGVLSLDQLKTAKERVSHQEQNLKDELEKIEKKMNSVDRTENRKRQLSDFYDILKTKDVPRLKAWLQQRIKQIKFTDLQNIEITFNE